jgi:hypothetical protein
LTTQTFLLLLLSLSMVEDIFKKFGGRFENHLPTRYNSNSFLPTFSLKDTTDGEVFTIQIDSFAADPETVLENVLREKIINKREQKINSLINETKT